MDTKSASDNAPLRPRIIAVAAIYGILVSTVCFAVSVSAPEDLQSPIRLDMPNTLAARLCQWDGQWYGLIAKEGYSFDPERTSSVAFFPLYPLLVSAVQTITALPLEYCLLIVSHTGLLATLFIFATYARERCFDEVFTLGTFAFFPTSFFLVMGYSETTFTTLAALFLLSDQRRWPLWVRGLIVGLATATRPVGVALIPPLLLQMWRAADNESMSPNRECSDSRRRWKQFLVTAAWVLPLSCSGLAFYMLYQQIQFGTPFAFIQTQGNWRMRPDLPWYDHLAVLLSLEPIWSVFVPNTTTHWSFIDRSCPSVFFSLQAANPVLFMMAIAAILWGRHKRWLSDFETLMATGLIAIPYVTRSYEMCMASHGRFVLVSLPVFLVLGHLLDRAPRPLRLVYVTLSLLFLVLYSRSWAIGYLTI